MQVQQMAFVCAAVSGIICFPWHAIVDKKRVEITQQQRAEMSHTANLFSITTRVKGENVCPVSTSNL